MGIFEELGVDLTAWDKMTPVERADLLFTKGYSCSQSALCCFGRQYGLELEKALELTRAFGSGMGQGYTCGAVVGAFMVLGLGVEPLETERQTRYKTYDLVKEFISRFSDRHGAINCKDLLSGVDLSTEEGRLQAKEQNLFTTVCPKFVRDAAQILDDLLPERTG